MPTPPAEPPLTLLLRRMQQGDRQAGDRAVDLIYRELHGIAARQMRREAPGHLLQTTALVNEAWLRLHKAGDLDIRNRGHFLALAAQQMRRILVDSARAASADQRGGHAVHIGLDQTAIGVPSQSFDILALDEALSALEQIDPRAAKVVELRYFGGYTDKEVAESLAVPLITVRRDWEFARSWLYDRMRSDPPPRQLK